MAVLEAITGFAMSTVGGGLFGYIASAANRLIGIKEAKIKFDQDKQRAEWTRSDKAQERQHIANMHKLNAENRKAETEQEIRLIERRFDGEARIASHKDQTALALNPQGEQWTINLLRLVRPILTLYFAICALIIFIMIKDVNIRSEVVMQLLYLAGMSCGWWFGDAAKRTKPNA